MSNFQVHVDVEEAGRRKKIENKQIVSKKRANVRVAFQTVNNIQHETKRPKLRATKNSAIGRPIEPVKEVKVEKKQVPLNFASLQLAEKENDKNSDNKLKKIDKWYIPRALLHTNEYKDDIWVYLKDFELQCDWPSPDYMEKQKHLTHFMRHILVDWLASVAEEYKMDDQSLHLAVNFIDRFLSRMSVIKAKFQLLGTAALMVAGKIEEVYPPDAKEWVSLTNGSYTITQMLRMELMLLRILNFDLQPPTMLTFIQHLCIDHGLDKKTLYLAKYLSELVLLEGDDYLEHLPSKLAAASVMLARITLSKRNPWPKTLEASSGYNVKQLSPIVHRQNITFKDSPTKPQQSIQLKYQRDDYHKVAFLKAKSLSFEDFENE